MNFKPMQDRVLVKRQKEESKTKGGLLIPDSAAEKSSIAEVVAVGEGKRLKNGQLIELPFKKGDLVLLGKYSGTEVRIDGEDYIVIKSDEILGYQSK